MNKLEIFQETCPTRLNYVAMYVSTLHNGKTLQCSLTPRLTPRLTLALQFFSTCTCPYSYHYRRDIHGQQMS